MGLVKCGVVCCSSPNLENVGLVVFHSSFLRNRGGKKNVVNCLQHSKAHSDKTVSLIMALFCFYVVFM